MDFLNREPGGDSVDDLVECRPIRLKYFLRIPNVGDLINPIIVSAVTGEQTAHASGDAPHLLAIGSVMGGATPHSCVWGTGVMHPDIGVGSPEASRLYAVRGKLSHAALRQAAIGIGDVPLGDPGFLAPAIFGVERSPVPEYRLGVVPHYVDRANQFFRYLLSDPDVVDLNVHQEPGVFLRQMADCGAVISSSLHGLIFAEALGIPNLWVKSSDEISGAAFKFDDWFTTTARPQRNVHLLRANDAVNDLIDRASLHESMIDVAALGAAFPHQALEELREAESRLLLPTSACRERPTPTFLISFNRGALLERAIDSLKRQSRRTEIVVHDNGSTDAETIGVLERIERTGTRVFRHSTLASVEDLNKVNETVQAFFADWAEPSRYIVSDCDIDMAVAAPEALDVYDELLNVFRHVDSVGPMLRIRDIPPTYPLFNRVMNRHIEQFWHRQPLWAETSFGRVAYLDASIDTTMAIHRAGEPFFRLKQSLRIYEPYEAQHLDWYLESIGDTNYASTSDPGISHWNNSAEHNRHKYAELEYQSFYSVRVNGSRVLEVREERVTPAARKKDPIKPFAEASEQERNARIVRTEGMRTAGSSDVKRWENDTSHYDSWQERGRRLATFVQPGERVFEFGAGNSAIPAALPPGCGYAGSDLAPLKDGIIVLDLNARILPPLLGHDVAVFSGVLEYVHDLARLSAFLSRHFQGVVCSYALRMTSEPEEIVKRRYSGWFSDLTADEFKGIFAAAGFGFSRQEDWTGQALFRWDRQSEKSTKLQTFRRPSVFPKSTG
jgi:hypothetical protein